LALAAAMIVYVTARSGPDGPELPPYTVTATGEAAMRGAAEEASTLRLAKEPARDARFELVLRPATAPAETVVAYPFTVTAPGAEPAPLDAKVELAPEGAVRVTGDARALRGAAELRVVVGAPADIGKFVDAAARAAEGRSDARVR